MEGSRPSFKSNWRYIFISGNKNGGTWVYSDRINLYKVKYGTFSHAFWNKLASLAPYPKHGEREPDNTTDRSHSQDIFRGEGMSLVNISVGRIRTPKTSSLPPFLATIPQRIIPSPAMISRRYGLTACVHNRSFHGSLLKGWSSTEYAQGCRVSEDRCSLVMGNPSTQRKRSPSVSWQGRTHALERPH